MTRCLPVTLITLLAALLVSDAGAQEWTRFRGPNGQGISDATTIPLKFTAADYNWKIMLPGEGHGSPVIWGDKVFLIAGDPRTADRFVIRVSAADGSIVWTKKFSSSTHHLNPNNSFGASTPAVDADRVYTYWGAERSSVVIALDHAGNVQWEYDLGPYISNHGPGTSPMLYKDLVVITHDADDTGAVVALNKSDGKVRWKLERKGADNGASYGVPVVYQGADGKEQLIVTSRAHGMTGIDPAKGAVVWEKDDIFNMRSVAGPVIAGDLIFSQCGSGGGGKRFVAIRPASTGGPASLAWEKTRAIPYVPTPVMHGGYLYYLTDGGHAACVEPTQGDIKWSERAGNASFFGSPVVVNGHIYAITKAGECIVFRATPDKFDLVSVNPLGEKSYATPAIAGGKMYLRTVTQLISVGGK